MKTLLVAFLLVPWFTVGCGDSDSDSNTNANTNASTNTNNAAQDELPSHEERIMLFWTNRLRAEPGPFEAESVRALLGDPSIVHAPQPPLEYGLDLGEAARWQADHIQNTICGLCEDHSSCCEMGEVGGEIVCLSEVTTCGVTTRNERFAFFSDRATGENGAQGFRSAQEVIRGWVDSSVHYSSMMSGSFTAVGPGQSGTVHHLVFGSGSTRPILNDGIHFREMHRLFDGWSYSAIFAPENEPTFGLSYYLEGGSAPDLAEVVIEGESRDLALTYGVANWGTYETTLVLDPGCHRYYFRLIDSNGDEHLYPTVGTLGAGVQSDCALYQTP